MTWKNIVKKDEDKAYQQRLRNMLEETGQTGRLVSNPETKYNELNNMEKIVKKALQDCRKIAHSKLAKEQLELLEDFYVDLSAIADDAGYDADELRAERESDLHISSKGRGYEL